MGDAPEYYDLRRMTSPEVRAALPDIGCVLIPVGSCECHGPNIALGSDAGQAEAYSRLLAQRVHPRVAVAPTLNYGISEGHMHSPGTTTLTAETFMQVTIEVASNFGRHGFGRFLFMNGHGGNKNALTLVCDALLARHGLLAAHLVVGELGGFEVAGDIYQGYDVGHACEFETSSAMYLCPELVREATLAKGDFVPNTVRHTREMGAPIHRSYYWEERSRNTVLGDAATGASAEHGRTMTERGLEILDEFLEDFCKLPVPAHADR